MMKIIPALDNFSHLFLCRPCSRFRTGGHSDGHSHAQGRRWNRQHGWRVRRWETTLQLGQMCKTNSVSYETLSCFLDYVCVMWFSDTNRDSFFFKSQGTNRYFQRIAAEVGLDVSFADCTKPQLLKAALKPNTKVCQSKNYTSEDFRTCVVCLFVFGCTF